MSDRVAQPDPDSERTARKSMNHYQAAWMDHWKHASHKPSTEVHSRLRNSPGMKKEDHYGTEMETNISNYSEARTDDTLKKNLRTDSKKLGKEILDGQPLPLFSNRGNAMSSKNNAGTSSDGEAAKYQIDLNDGYNFLALGTNECVYPEGISLIPQQLVKPHEFLEGNNLAVSSSFQVDVGSCSKIVPYVVHSGQAPTQSIYQHENIDQPSAVVAFKEHLLDSKLSSYSNFWGHEKKAGAVFESGRAGNSLSRQNVAPLLHNDQSRNDSLNKQSQKVENASSIGLLPSFCGPKANKSGKEHDEHFLLPRIPRSAHDVKAMRICTTIDSVEGLPRGPPNISQTTHQFFITKKTGVDLTEGHKFRYAIVSPKLKGNMFNEFMSLSPSFSLHGQQGVKLQLLESSTDSERTENVEDIRTSTVCLKNESSIETDAMELDAIQKNLLSSVALSPSDQNIKGAHKSSSSETENATGEAGNKMNYTELPDMNEELPALPAEANSTEDGGTSISRTQSLDAEHLFCNADRPSNSNTTACPNSPLGQDPGSRWVKRLKLNTSEPFASGTKSSKLGEVLSRVKINTTSKIVNCSKKSSEATVGRSHVRTKLALDQTPVQLMNGDSTSSGSVRKSQEISSSHAWIHRWCRLRSAPRNRKPDAPVICEPQSSKATLDELQEKQFPSIAAMALMGKAIKGFHPCEFRKSGSMVVWNT